MSDEMSVQGAVPPVEVVAPQAEPGVPRDEVVAYLDELLGAAAFDRTSNGLVVEGRATIQRVGLAVNCSREAMGKALERGCDLLITHHAAWASTDACLAQAKVDELKAREVSLYVAHECLDCARDLGTADALARAARMAVRTRPPAQVRCLLSRSPISLIRSDVTSLTPEPESAILAASGTQPGMPAGFTRPFWSQTSQVLQVPPTGW